MPVRTGAGDASKHSVTRSTFSSPCEPVDVPFSRCWRSLSILSFLFSLLCNPLRCDPMDFLIRSFLTVSLLVSFAVAHPRRHLQHGLDHLHQRRQDGGAPFAGIEMLPTPAGSDSNPPISTTLTRTSQLTSQPSSSRATGPTTYISVGTTSIGPISITIRPVAIATMCPPEARPQTTSIGTSVALSPTLLDAKIAQLLPAEEIALLRLNSTGANETSAVVPTFTAYNGSGCSTLYTRTASALCSTVLAGLGAIPVTVTNCVQSITFSTSTGSGPLPMAATHSTTSIGGSSGEQLVYFVAPWYAVASGRMPNTVLVKICAPGREKDDCGTATESWNVVNQTSSVDVTSRVAFVGMVTGVSAD